jgi:exodeoxyribonuclease V alpha subunit
LLRSTTGMKLDQVIGRFEASLGLKLAFRQKTAIRQSVEEKVMVLTGGPGTGKTTIIRGILALFASLNARILLAAPTGRAAKRMSEATGFPACTLHRLLEYGFAAGGFQRNEDHPLKCDLLVVDEMSMVDVVLMHHLLKAVPLSASLLLVGDVEQLPSVGAGNVLGDILSSRRIPVVVLDRIFRQAWNSRIIVNAHRIQEGKLPLADEEKADSDFYFIEKDNSQAVLDLLLRLVGERIPQKFGLDPFDEIQVLTPMHKGVVGAANLNRSLQQLLNPGAEGILHDGFSYRTGDKVMQVRNNYDRDVYNGDVGRILRIDREANQLTVGFDAMEVTYPYIDLDEIRPAYAISVHKSQGSEYPAVVLPIVTEHYILLQRNLIYTGLTRGQRLVVVVGSRRALQIAVNNDKTLRRYTRLSHRLSRSVRSI